MISITLCMIVKNEQSILERCLISYAGTYDELIIVDTGSTDSTKDIAHKYTDKVYDYKWCDDFAAARNYAFSLASCDYIFSADADEILDERNNQALKAAPGRPSRSAVELLTLLWNQLLRAGSRCPADSAGL